MAASTERSRLLVDYLRHLRLMGERDIFVGPGKREPILERAGQLASLPQRGAFEVPPDPGQLARLAREGTADEIRAIESRDRLKSVADACTRCDLARSRTNPVFADGSAAARVVCVGEAPGQREDETGVPFVGRAGQLLDRLLLAVGLDRSSVFICNVLKCRPPGNRNPTPEEVELCSPFLRRQVALVDPRVVVAFGTFAARALLGSKDSLGRLRRRLHTYEGRPLVVTYHPAALLRNPRWIRPAWVDLQRMRALLDGDGPSAASGELASER